MEKHVPCWKELHRNVQALSCLENLFLNYAFACLYMAHKAQEGFMHKMLLERADK